MCWVSLTMLIFSFVIRKCFAFTARSPGFDSQKKPLNVCVSVCSRFCDLMRTVSVIKIIWGPKDWS